MLDFRRIWDVGVLKYKYSVKMVLILDSRLRNLTS